MRFTEKRAGAVPRDLDMLSALTINVLETEQNPFVAVALSVPLIKANLASSEMVAAWERLMKHLSLVCVVQAS